MGEFIVTKVSELDLSSESMAGTMIKEDVVCKAARSLGLRVKKVHRRISLEEFDERWSNLRLCMFCGEQETPDHHLQHKNEVILMIDCDEDQIRNDEELVESEVATESIETDQGRVKREEILIDYLEEELAAAEEEEEDYLPIVSRKRMETIVNDYEDLISEGQSESPKMSQSVKLQSSDVLDCPTCFEPLTRPIYQCKNGHLACSSCCKKRNNRCSFCRCHIGDIRCIAMEKVIESSVVPCPNAKYGCKETTTYSDQSTHEKTCFFVPCFCPVPDCNYIGSYTNLKSHASAAHSWDKDELIPLKFDNPIIFSMDLGKRKMVVFKEEKECDLIVVQAFKGSEGVYVTVNRIAPMTPGIPNISCSLAKLDDFSSLRIGLNVQKIQEVREQLHPEDDVIWIPPKMLSGAWKMKICIGDGYKYIHTV